MCVDKNGLAFIMAIMAKKEPPPGVGFGYMLQGGGSASNADPYAPAPADGKWEPDDPPHVMIFGAKEARGLSATHLKPGRNTALCYVPGHTLCASDDASEVNQANEVAE